MKYVTTISKEIEEEKVLIYAKERSALVNEIEKLIDSSGIQIVGTLDDETKLINPLDVVCFISDNNKVYAYIDNKKYRIKEKLYMLEELDIKEYFVKINQSCYANIKKISKFEVSIGGSIMVLFNNGYKDYISRRELKNVKERMGL